MFEHLSGRRLDPSLAALCILALLAFLDSLFNYVWTGNGIHGSQGALLVLVATLLMTAAAAVLLWRWATGAVATVLHVLLALDFIGTGFAAYLLQAWVLLALDILAALAWLAHLTLRRRVAIRAEA
jgi:hypothetical protein